jgi:hypothetical protein
MPTKKLDYIEFRVLSVFVILSYDIGSSMQSRQQAKKKDQFAS